MPTRQAESIHEAEPNHPVPDPKAPGVESPSAEEMKGASSLPQDTNADDVTAGDQDIDTAGTEADELSVRHSSLGLPKSDGASPTKST